MDHHDVCSGGRRFRGDRLEIDMSNASPIKQPIRWMPYAAKEEVAR